MPDTRLLRILTRLASPEPSGDLSHLCVVCAEVTRMSGAGITLIWDAQPQGTVCTTNDVSSLLEDLQYTLGEGPSIDACRQRVPVVEPDLARPAVARWPEFARAAVAAGARAVFGFPMSIGDLHLGALNLYHDAPGPLTDDQHADALVLAEVAARAVLSMQADAPPGALGEPLEAGGNFHFVVHQAAGMVAVRLSVTVDEALLQLRAHALSSGRPLADIAADVVAGSLQLDADDR